MSSVPQNHKITELSDKVSLQNDIDSVTEWVKKMDYHSILIHVLV